MTMNIIEAIIYEELMLLKAEASPRNIEVEYALELLKGYKSMVQEQEFRVAEIMKEDFFNYVRIHMGEWYESLS